MTAKKTTRAARTTVPAKAVKQPVSPLTWALAISFTVLSVVFMVQVMYYYL